MPLPPRDIPLLSMNIVERNPRCAGCGTQVEVKSLGLKPFRFHVCKDCTLLTASSQD